MTREEMIERVRKCLALSRSSNEAEAQAALAMAQKLLGRYHLSLAEVDAFAAKAADAHCRKLTTTVSGMREWVRRLAEVVARNFRCEVAFSATRNHCVVLVGTPLDLQVAEEVLSVAVSVADRLGNNLSQRISDRGECSRGAKESFCRGFVAGLGQMYAEQVATECLGLMVIAPPEAQAWKASLQKAHMGFKTTALMDHQAYAEGIQRGRDFAGQRRLEGTPE